jgi:peroxiredoxin
MMRERLRRLASRARRARLGRWIEGIAWVVLLAFVGSRLWPQLAAAIGVEATSTLAPDFRLVTLDGREVTRESLRGKVVLVNFWATWCPPCRVEMPGFQRLWASRRDSGFVVLGLSADRTGPEQVAGFLRERGYDYPVAMATREVEQGFGGAPVLPTSFLVDREGRVRHVVRGIFTEVALARAVDRLLAEPRGRAR